LPFLRKKLHFLDTLQSSGIAGHADDLEVIIVKP